MLHKWVIFKINLKVLEEFQFPIYCFSSQWLKNQKNLMSVMIVIMITINVGIKVIKRQLMNKNQLKIKLFKQVKHINYKKTYHMKCIHTLFTVTVPYFFSVRSSRIRDTGLPSWLSLAWRWLFDNSYYKGLGDSLGG